MLITQGAIALYSMEFIFPLTQPFRTIHNVNASAL